MANITNNVYAAFISLHMPWLLQGPFQDWPCGGRVYPSNSVVNHVVMGRFLQSNPYKSPREHNCGSHPIACKVANSMC